MGLFSPISNITYNDHFSLIFYIHAIQYIYFYLRLKKSKQIMLNLFYNRLDVCFK